MAGIFSGIGDASLLSLGTLRGARPHCCPPTHPLTPLQQTAPSSPIPTAVIPVDGACRRCLSMTAGFYSLELTHARLGQFSESGFAALAPALSSLEHLDLSHNQASVVPLYPPRYSPTPRKFGTAN